jgi:hypothetical protein
MCVRERCGAQRGRRSHPELVAKTHIRRREEFPRQPALSQRACTQFVACLQRSSRRSRAFVLPFSCAAGRWRAALIMSAAHDANEQAVAAAVERARVAVAALVEPPASGFLLQVRVLLSRVHSRPTPSPLPSPPSHEAQPSPPPRAAPRMQRSLPRVRPRPTPLQPSPPFASPRHACALAPRPRHGPRPPRMERSPRHPLARPLACSTALATRALAPRPRPPPHAAQPSPHVCPHPRLVGPTSCAPSPFACFILQATQLGLPASTPRLYSGAHQMAGSSSSTTSTTWRSRRPSSALATQSPPSSPSHRPNFWKECDQRCSKRRRRCSSSREEGGHGPCRPRATSLQCPLMTLGGQREKRCTPRWRISRQWASADNMRTVHKRYVKLKKIVSARLALASPGYRVSTVGVSEFLIGHQHE